MNIDFLNKLKLSFEFQSIASQLQNGINDNDNLVGFSSDRYNVQVSTREANLKEFNDEFQMSFKTGIGRRTLNDSVKSKSNLIYFTGNLKKQFLLNQRMTFFHTLNIATIRNEVLYTNELYRVGGFLSFRGFNENEFFLESYAYVNNELRFFFEERSFLFTLYDTGYLKGNNTKSLSDLYYALGFGLVLGNSNGDFSIIFASGSSYDQPLSVTNTNVHFGYTAFF
jgi:hemolysin activation/secretion protein